MNAGYGRGYYGASQLAPRAPQRRAGWGKIIAIIGVGAVVWFMWPRKPSPTAFFGSGGGGKDPEPPPPSSPQPSDVRQPVVTNTVGTGGSQLVASAASVPPPTGGFRKQLEDDAQARGFVSVNDYEDSVVATAKQLQATGAQVVLAPHLQHLASKLSS